MAAQTTKERKAAINKQIKDLEKQLLDVRKSEGDEVKAALKKLKADDEEIALDVVLSVFPSLKSGRVEGATGKRPRKTKEEKAAEVAELEKKILAFLKPSVKMGAGAIKKATGATDKQGVVISAILKNLISKKMVAKEGDLSKTVYWLKK
ncbi:MAG: hypothetical protein WCH57_06170 [Verrucomicrobiota bacterium]